MTRASEHTATERTAGKGEEEGAEGGGARERRTILVTGATGSQGGAVARYLLKERDRFQVRAMTRDPDQENARRLRERGAEVVRGDYDDEASLERAVDGVHGVFAVQTPYEDSVEAEIEHGRRMIDVARAAGVEQFVQASVASCDRDTGIPFFDSKAEIEAHLRDSGLPHTVLRPVFFMQNWGAPQVRDQVLSCTLAQPLSPDTSLQQIDVEDIGAIAVLAFKHPDAWIGRTLELAGDERSMQGVAATLSDVLENPVEYRQADWDDFSEVADEATMAMYRWFEETGYDVDIESLREELPFLSRLEDYLERAPWTRRAEVTG